MSAFRVGIVGCGAVSELLHLPAMRRSGAVVPAVLCDPAIDRARALADKLGIPDAVASHRDLAGRVEAALVAAPNHLHAAITRDLLAQGIHVLVEKIMTLSTADALSLVEAAGRADRVLSVGLEFRFFQPIRFVKQMLAAGMLGDILDFDVRLGVILNWPVKSSYLMNRAAAGGGVLNDFGPHILDLVLWWLGDWTSVQYADDAHGGVEANATMTLQLDSGASGTVELSRNRVLRNTAIITGTNGRLEVGLWDPAAPVRLIVRGEPIELDGRCTMAGIAQPDTFHAAVGRQWADFAAAIRERRPPFITGMDGVRHVRLIEACYAGRTPLIYAWEADKHQADKLQANTQPEAADKLHASAKS
jgi:predicted dehydrogenase